MNRAATGAHLLVLIALLGALLGALPAAARTSWVSVRDLDGGDDLCLVVDSRRFTYTELVPGETATATIHGPRRLKLIARYLFTAAEDRRQPYTVTVAVDGREVLSKTFTGEPLATVSRCRGAGEVSALRKGYVEIPAGRHQVTIGCGTAGAGEVAVRLFRRVRRTRDRWMSLAPESYAEIRELEFASGSRSTYYALTADQPLELPVHGPTTLRVRTRLDFDHRMNGSQNYTLEVRCDREIWRTFHFDATRLSSAVYVDRPDILPGSRREFTISVPRGSHLVAIHCLRPEACGVAVTVDLPRRDLER